MSYFDLGSFHRKFTTNSTEAQTWLNRGFAWLFGFNHEEAIVCFEKALNLDKTCVAKTCNTCFQKQICSGVKI